MSEKPDIEVIREALAFWLGSLPSMEEWNTEDDGHINEAMNALGRVEAFVRWIAGMNPTSGEVTFEMRREMQHRARLLLPESTPKPQEEA